MFLFQVNIPMTFDERKRMRRERMGLKRQSEGNIEFKSVSKWDAFHSSEEV
jgi:hypothetical protein